MTTMATWVPVDPEIGLQPIASTSTTQNHPLGKIIKGKTTNLTTQVFGEFVYLLGVVSTVVGSAVIYDESDGTTKLFVAGLLGPVAVAMSANVASQYGWYQITGPAAILSATVADSAKVYIDTATGKIDDAFVTLNRVENAVTRSASDTTTITSATAATVGLSRAYINKIKDS